MKRTLRILGLTGAILLASLATGGAAANNCHLRCTSGVSYDFWTSNGSDCCAAFRNLCGSYGQGNWTYTSGVVLHCISYDGT